MSEGPGDQIRGDVAWRRGPRNRRWYRRLSTQTLAEARVRAPDGTAYFVRVRKNGPLVGSRGVDPSNPISTVLDLVQANATALGETGWRVEVVAPASGWGGENVLYVQPVGARVIVVDVVLAITNALERGDKLWAGDQE